MTMWDRIAVLVHRRSVLVCVCSLPFVALLVVHIGSQRSWRDEADTLRRENMSLALGQLAASIEERRIEAAEAARALAQSESVVEFVQQAGQQAGAAAPLRVDSGLASFDALVISVPPALKWSGAIVEGRLVEQPPDPAVVRYLDSLAAARSASTSALSAGELALLSGRYVAARAIFTRGSTVPVGWLAAIRDASPALPASLTQAIGGSLEEIRGGELAALPADLRSWLGPHQEEALEVRTRLSGDGSGYAVLRDESGRPARILKVAPAQAQASAARSGPYGKVALQTSMALVLAAVAAGLLVGLIATLKRYFHQRISVDSRYKAIIDQTHDGIVIVDPARYRIEYCNPTFLERVGYAQDEIEALTLPDIFADGDASPQAVIAKLTDADSMMALSMQLACKSGARIDVEVRCNRLGSDGRDGLAFVTHDVSVRRKAEQQLIDNQQRLDHMAHHDQLTGLPNRHYLTTFLPEAIAQARASGTMLGVVFLDLDRFKHINDTRGHEMGDKLLQEVARRVRACVRDSDVVIRMGGDEFVVVLREVKACEEVTCGANRIIETLNKPIVIDQHPLQTTASVGVSLFPRDGADMGELLKHSDTAMYQAKDRGRNNVQMFSQIMNRKLKHRVAMEASLREALRLKQLDVHYQPFVNLLTRQVVGLEALIRWRHPVHGMIPADQFIPVAEETGLIVPMGNFVLHRTLQVMSAWQRAGVKLVPVSLNVAPAQLQRGELESTISTLLKSHALTPDLLQLEMTERAVFDSSQAKIGENRQDTMMRLRDLGIKIAIDDFGTGYSSLSYLKNWRVDALKIDRSFVRDLATDSSDLAIVSAIIAIARHLHIQVIAEGIEGYQQAEILRKMGCTVGQGFLFARPMAPDQCLGLLGSNAASGEEEDMLAVFASGRV
ncbi:MAG TPA: EAL domain-containing protein [Steroidobacteraceae bacterium]|nr:EAL domain-containing protein [Steroidobacteraceae bacterium]